MDAPVKVTQGTLPDSLGDALFAPPAKATDYRLPSGIDAGLNAADFSELARSAHRLGLSQGEFGKLTMALGQSLHHEADPLQPIDRYTSKTDAALRARWGDDFDRRMALARDEAGRFMSDSMLWERLFLGRHFASHQATSEILAARGEFNARKRKE